MYFAIYDTDKYIYTTFGNRFNILEHINESSSTHIIPIIVPSKAFLKKVKYERDQEDYEDKYYMDYTKVASKKIIFGDKYSIFDPNTIIKFKLKVPSKYIRIASMNGHVHVLEWWKNSGLPLEYSCDAITLASYNGHINVLEWWKNSGLELKYGPCTMDTASEHGRIDILDWWKNSGLELKYSRFSMDCTDRVHICINVLDWWKNSGLPLKYTSDGLCRAKYYNNYKYIEWWKNSGLPLECPIDSNGLIKIDF
uniref:Ankyrin repeat protein n=1 Tax=viral metagenome TaxID=1070528 RepID=A0A6C0EAQ3_9ZZZZ